MKSKRCYKCGTELIEVEGNEICPNCDNPDNYMKSAKNDIPDYVG